MAEEGFNNQANRATHSVDTSKPLLPASLVIITHWTHDQNGHVLGMEVMHGLT